MSCKRATTATSLLVAFLVISLLPLHLPIASARHVVVLKTKNDVNIRGGLNLAKEPSVLADDLTTTKGSEGRKVGVEKTEKGEAMEVKESGDKKGKATISRLKKLKGSSSKDMMQQEIFQDAIEAHKPASVTTTNSRGNSHPRTMGAKNPSRKFKLQKHRDTAAEMFNMLNRDYSSRARRRSPINNDEPMHEEP